MINRILYISFFVFVLATSAIKAEETNYNPDKILLAFENGSKKQTVILLTAIKRSVDYYESSKDQKFLLRFLGSYKELLEHKDAFFLVDPLTDIYKKEPEIFTRVLKNAMSKKKAEKLMEHIQNILREAAEGNG